MVKGVRVVKLPYGVGCSKCDNCFTCKIQPDCACLTKEVNKPSILVDQEIIWSGKIRAIA